MVVKRRCRSCGEYKPVSMFDGPWNTAKLRVYCSQECKDNRKPYRRRDVWW